MSIFSNSYKKVDMSPEDSIKAICKNRTTLADYLNHRFHPKLIFKLDTASLRILIFRYDEAIIDDCCYAKLGEKHIGKIEYEMMRDLMYEKILDICQQLL